MIKTEKEYVNKRCKKCDNKNNNEDLCNITRRIDNSVYCANFTNCMLRKCHTCKNETKCFKYT